MHLYIGFHKFADDGTSWKFPGMMVDLSIHANTYVARQGSTPGTEKMSMNTQSPHKVHSIDEVWIIVFYQFYPPITSEVYIGMYKHTRARMCTWGECVYYNYDIVIVSLWQKRRIPLMDDILVEIQNLALINFGGNACARHMYTIDNGILHE